MWTGEQVVGYSGVSCVTRKEGGNGGLASVAHTRDAWNRTKYPKPSLLGFSQTPYWFSSRFQGRSMDHIRNLTEVLDLGLGDGSVGKVFAIQTRGPKFDSPASTYVKARCGHGQQVDSVGPSVQAW